jgi:hypothetical protein
MIKNLVRKTDLLLFDVISHCYFSATLNKEDFIEAFESIIDPVENRNQLEKLFDKVFE